MNDMQRLTLGGGVYTVHADIRYVVTKQPTKAAWRPWPVDPEKGVRVTCDVGYLCANFGLPIHDRQAVARSGRWHKDCLRRYTLCSDLNS